MRRHGDDDDVYERDVCSLDEMRPKEIERLRGGGAHSRRWNERKNHRAVRVVIGKRPRWRAHFLAFLHTADGKFCQSIEKKEIKSTTIITIAASRRTMRIPVCVYCVFGSGCGQDRTPEIALQMCAP